jgi:CheY-like chemotaxis protein
VSRTILIVDDEAHLRMLIQQTLEELEDEGVELLTATNGEEALATIEAVKPDLVFLDVMMPKLSGFDVITSRNTRSGFTASMVASASSPLAASSMEWPNSSRS